MLEVFKVTGKHEKTFCSWTGTVSTGLIVCCSCSVIGEPELRTGRTIKRWTNRLKMDRPENRVDDLKELDGGLILKAFVKGRDLELIYFGPGKCLNVKIIQRKLPLGRQGNKILQGLFD